MLANVQSWMIGTKKKKYIGTAPLFTFSSGCSGVRPRHASSPWRGRRRCAVQSTQLPSHLMETGLKVATECNIWFWQRAKLINKWSYYEEFKWFSVGFNFFRFFFSVCVIVELFTWRLLQKIIDLCIFALQSSVLLWFIKGFSSPFHFCLAAGY